MEKLFLNKLKRLGKAMGLNIDIKQKRSFTLKVLKYIFGIKIFVSTKEAHELDTNNKNHKWDTGINNEIAMLLKYEVFTAIADHEKY